MSNEAKDQEAAAEVFRETIALVEDGGFAYAVGGRLATDHWTGGADRISDVDLLIREDQSKGILEHLQSHGFDPSEMEHSWLHKAFKKGVTVDLMFELRNGTRFDAELEKHLRRGEMFGSTPYVLAPEDQIASIAGTVDRDTIGSRWYEMIDLLAKNDVDWDYLVHRARAVPLQMLSVLYFALSERIPVQKGIVERLVEQLEEDDA